MPISLLNKRRRPSLCKGLLAGAIAGLAGGLTKAAAESIYPPRVEGQVSPPVLLTQRAAGRSLRSGEKKLAEHSVHFVFSGVIGALYGAAAEWWPGVTAGSGAVFALALLAGTHESALPALDLVEPPHKQPMQEQLSETLTHLVFGVTLEQVRSGVRPLL